VKEVIADPHRPCILVRTRLEGDPRFLARLRLFALLAPHLEVGGWGNSGYVAEAALEFDWEFEPPPAAGARGQDLPGRDDRLAQHSRGRGEA
jgi:hypothetical protein